MAFGHLTKSQLRGIPFALAALAWPAFAQAAVVKGPVLGDVTKDGVTIRWFTDQPSLGTVSYGTNPTSLSQSSVESVSTTDHEVRLTQLSAATDYYYAIASGTDKVEGPDLSFRTAPGACAPFRFVVFGDTRGATSLCDNFTDWGKVSMMIAAQQADFAVGTGDYTYAGATPSCWDHWFDEAGALLRGTPLFPVIGNHEYQNQKYTDETDPGLIAFSRWFPVPSGPQVGVATTYYAFTYGNARFVVFDSFKDISPGSEQLAWIETELAAAYAAPDVQHIFVASHATFEGAGSFCLMGDQVQKNIRAYIEPLVEKYAADATFVGHEHSYQRAYKAGVHHIVTGGGGSPLESIAGLGCNLPLCISPMYLVKYNSCVFHALSVEVDGTHVTYRAIADDGVTTIDSWEDDRGGDKTPVCEGQDGGVPDAAPPPPDTGTDSPVSHDAAPGAGGSNAGSDAGVPAGKPQDSEDSGGCGCRQAPLDPGGVGWLSSVALLALARLRRRSA